jgi:tetraacyldisaccharide 4'-kinase
VPIVADARRVRAAARAETLETSVDMHLLDDGFSHVGLARDVDVVLLDATDPDAGGALLPAGLLREPLAALARADLLVVTKTEQADPGAALELARRYAPGVPVFRARTEVLGVTDRDGRPVDPSNLPEGTTVAVSGIARPGAFRSTLEAIGVVPAEFLEFRDHEPYGPASVGRVERALEETGATAVVTTEKDAVKLEGALGVPVFRVAVEARVVEASFVSDVLSLLSRRPS